MAFRTNTPEVGSISKVNNLSASEINPCNPNCEFCTNVKGDPSLRRTCQLFRQLKRECTKTSYIESSLREQDTRGYAASGILMCRRSLQDDTEIELLFAREERKSRNLLNFLGGKRWKHKTAPLDCAVEIFDRETGGVLPRDSIKRMKEGNPIVCWDSKSNYAIHVFEACILDYDVDVESKGLRGEKDVKAIEWVKRTDLMDTQWARAQFHDFAFQTIDQLIRCNIMQHLEAIFDSSEKEDLQHFMRKS